VADSPAINLHLHEPQVRPRLLTFRDCIEHGIRYLGGAGTQAASQEEIRSAVISAYEELSHSRKWRYYTKRGRIHLQSNQDTGTVAYDHSTRRMTLSGATWPANVTRGYVKTGQNTLSRVQRKISSTVVELDPVVNPGADISSGASYEWYRSSYLLPPDFLHLHEPVGQGPCGGLSLGSNAAMLAADRFAFSTFPGCSFSISGAGDGFGGMAMHIHGSPGTISDANRVLDFVYVSTPYPLSISGFEQEDTKGTVALSGGSATVTGTGTSWHSQQNGAVFRTARNSRLPTDSAGLNAFLYEGLVYTVDSTSQITLAHANDGDAVLPASTVSGRGFVISDAVDIAPYMRTALLRGIEWQLTQCRNMKNRGQVFETYKMAFRHAASVDGHPSTQRRWAGEGPWGCHCQRLGQDGLVGAEIDGGP